MSSEELPPRESMEFDVVIVGAGPSGLAAAIRLKQLNADLNIVVVEKGSEVGAHILSGAVIDPVALDKLVPEWRTDEDCLLKTQVTDDRFYWMTATSAIRLPLPWGKRAAKRGRLNFRKRSAEKLLARAHQAAGEGARGFCLNKICFFSNVTVRPPSADAFTSNAADFSIPNSNCGIISRAATPTTVSNASIVAPATCFLSM